MLRYASGDWSIFGLKGIAMSKILKTAALSILNAGLWVWAGGKVMLDWLGYTIIATDLTVHDSTASKIFRWIFDTPWYAPAGLATLATCAAIYAFLRKDESKQAPAPATARPAPTANGAPAAKTTQATWLEELADKDERQIEQRLYFQNCEVTPNLSAIVPYVDLQLVFINASVFTLTLEKIAGRLNYYNDPLKDEPEIEKTRGLELDSPKQRTIDHGELRHFTIKQWLTKEVADKMIANNVKLMPGGAGMYFSFETRSGIRKEFRRGFPNKIE